MESRHTISNLLIYPIKSMAGIQLDHAVALKEGFENDRRMMLVDDSGKFVSQRDHAKMALFKTSIVESLLTIEFGKQSLSVPLSFDQNDSTPVSVWGSKISAYEIDQKYSQWFSEILNQKVRLVGVGEKTKRYKRLFKSPYSTYVSFADGYPYLLLGEESLRELNNRCPEPMDMDRFRPNIVIESEIAHEEDDFETFNLGQAKFGNIKPCVRCVMVTIDQKKATKSPEPLATLNNYRKKNNKIRFGTNLVCLQEGRVRVGDVLSNYMVNV